MRLLLIEDEDKLRRQLTEKLQQSGYSVDTAADGQSGLFQATEYPLDLAIIDLGLPKLSGLDIVRQVRQQNFTYPILILTARGNWQDKVTGLEAGADDYLVKPFHFEELLARLNALLRRSAGKASPLIQLGPISIDTSSQQVCVAQKPVELTSYEYRVLEYLILNSDKVVSKTQLTEHIYDQDFDRDSNVIEVFVGRLRKKLDPDNSLKPIQTVRGRGYRLTLTAELP